MGNEHLRENGARREAGPGPVSGEGRAVAPAGGKPVTNPAARRRNLLAFLALALAVVVLDQLTKVWAREALAAGRVTLIPGVLDLVLVGNTGAAFSIGEGSQWLFVALAAGICVACAAWVWREAEMPLSLALALGGVAGGGLGNMIDRVATGVVTDFFATTFIDFPVFNVADIFVTCGVALVLALWWRWDSERNPSGESEVR